MCSNVALSVHSRGESLRAIVLPMREGVVMAVLPSSACWQQSSIVARFLAMARGGVREGVSWAFLSDCVVDRDGRPGVRCT